MSGALHRFLPDGRLHLQHGPIDMILRADGPGAAAAHRAAVARFDSLLDELVAELPLLRRPVRPGACSLRGAVARHMAAAARAHLPAFVTPMAAVAGAGAQAVLQAMAAVPGVSRAFVNNGGDIALFFAGYQEAGQSAFNSARGDDPAPFRLAIVVDPLNPASPGVLEIASRSPWRGVATSGAKGRSHSLGIADSVTVIAADAAAADVAATLIANAVDLPGDGTIAREAAQDLAPDSDLGARLVTTHVPPLDPGRITAALERGEAAAQSMIARGLIGGALLVLQGTARVTGDMPIASPPYSALRNQSKINEALLHV